MKLPGWIPVLAIPLLAGGLFVGMRGIPVPFVHDEFSYLLAADTFAQGRVTNPPHPFAEHFETFHVNQKPTYASMYPPGQGLVLAAGQVAFGKPWFGVWASVVVLCGVVWWALRGWLPPSWALLGGVFAATMASMGYWLIGYWGGAVAAVGGALVLGAWPRLRRERSVKLAVIFALGIAILANTRMYEGLVLTVAACFGVRLRVWTRGMWCAAGLVLLSVACGMMYYFWRVTGDPLLMPYVVNFRTYGYHGLFLWQADQPQPFYNHDVMRRLYSDVLDMSRSDPAFLRVQLWPTLDQYGGALLLLPLCAAWWMFRSRKIRGLFVAVIAVMAAVSLDAWIRPHYVAPVMAGLIGVTVQALRYLHAWRVRGRQVGRFVAQGVVALWLVFQCSAGMSLLLQGAPPGWAVQRAAIEAALERTGKRHLILVRYAADHNPNQEWVYNGADLLGGPVLWARAMSPEEDRGLIAFYPDREVWRLEPDAGYRLIPWSSTP